MATLSRRLQTQGFCPHRPQQSPPLHRYKKPELQISLLGLKLFCYYFCIDYWQGKANRATDALLQYLQQNAKEKAIFQAENTKILYRLQSSLANVSGLFLDVSFPFYQIFICSTAVLPQLQRFWDSFQGEIANKSLYNLSIRAMRLKFSDLQSYNNQIKKLRATKLSKGWEDIEEVL